MPLFIALSGALYKKSLDKGRYSTFVELLNKKSKSLLIPFGAVTVLYSVPIKFISGYFNQSNDIEYSCAMKSHFRKFGNQMSGSGNHLCNYASLLA